MSGSTGLRRFVTAPRLPRPPRRLLPWLHLPGKAGPAPAGPGRPATGRRPAEEPCEFCATDIGAEHGHVADLDNSTLICTCRACYLLLTNSEAGGGRYRAVPDRYLIDPARPLSAAEWDDSRSRSGSRSSCALALRRGHGFYPSPAGATESPLDLAAWDRLTTAHPLLTAVEADVEAVLICRAAGGVRSSLVPIDACYELAGRMRLLWRGFDGGSEAREAIAASLAGPLAGPVLAGSPDVTELAFDCIGATADRFAVTPAMSFVLRIARPAGKASRRSRCAAR